MFQTAHRPPRPRLTGKIALYAIGDVFGLSCVAIGASYFIADKGAIFSGFPASTAEAVACTAGGVVVMFWSVARILREIAKQAPEMQAKFENYLRHQHPDKVDTIRQAPPQD